MEQDRAAWRPTVPPIHQASTFDFDSVEAMDAWYEGRVEGFHYTRYGNPTLASVEATMARLEAGDAAQVTASGMGAITETLLTLVSKGDRIVTVDGIYGGTHGLFTRLLPRFGVTVDAVSMDDPSALEEALRTPARVVYLETPTNPVLRLCDLREYARIARGAGATTVCDNTFATPVHTTPRGLGVDVVVHSATKALAGHADVTAGVVVADRERMAAIHATHKLVGSVLDPHAAFLLARGLKTLELRVKRMAETALRLARHLEGRPGVRRVHYPGLESHPQHTLAKRQMRGGFGGVVAVDLGERSEAFRFANALRVFHNAASLGGVDSLVSLPVVTSHRGLSASEMARMGISPGTVRLSCGVEDPEAILADVDAALKAL